MAGDTLTKTNELVITRIFNAPREVVWKAWTVPEHTTRWWGPKGFTAPVSRIDLRVGGKYLNDMRSPEGKDFWSTGIFREVVAPERLVMTDSFADEKGNVVSASHYGMSVDFPLELLITVTFEESDGKTKMTLKHSGVAGIPAADFDGMRQGWNESFDKLDEYLTILVKQASKTKVIAEPGKQEFFITREFAAPREMVFKAFVDRELIVQWLGPRRLTMTIDKFEPRSGGS